MFMVSLLLYNCVHVVCMDWEGWSLKNVVLSSATARMSVLVLVMAVEILLYYLLYERTSIALVTICGSTPARPKRRALSLQEVELDG